MHQNPMKDTAGQADQKWPLRQRFLFLVAAAASSWALLAGLVWLLAGF